MRIPSLILTPISYVTNNFLKGKENRDIYLFCLIFERFIFVYLAYAAFGPNSLLQNAKKWLRAGPRYHNYFSPEKTKALIIT